MMPVLTMPIRLSRTRKRLAKKIKALLLAAVASDLKTGVTYLQYQPILVVPNDTNLAAALQTVMTQLNEVLSIGQPGG